MKAAVWKHQGFERWKKSQDEYEAEREHGIKEAELEMREEREKRALFLEKKASMMRAQIIEEMEVNDDYIVLTSELERSDAGTLNLSSCQEVLPLHTCTHKEHKTALHKAAMYSDMAEGLQTENRKLRMEISEKVETVRNFWRNCILEQGTRAGKMVMLATRK